MVNVWTGKTCQPLDRKKEKPYCFDMDIFIELTVIVLVAALFAVIMRLLRQPLIVGYILAGILSGPYFLNILHSREHIELFSKIGITILLFIVGLNLSPKVIREVGKVSLITGLGQVIFTSAVGFVIAIVLGIDRIAALYVAIALTFSSTIIILKLLSDRGDLHKLYGKISIGFLLVQDIVATIILLLISSFAKGSSTDLLVLILTFLLKGIGLFLLLYLISTYIMPRLSVKLASFQELLFLFSLAWGLGLSSLFHRLGFSVEIGALIAGVALSLTPFAPEIGSRMKPLRDFFIVLFFILLGSQMVLQNFSQLLLPAVVLSLFVLVGNPVIVIVLMNLLGFKRRTGFMAGLTVAQISEFSLILATLGFSVGHLSREVLSLVTLVGLITITGSTYFILYSDKIYPKVEKALKILELKKNSREKTGAGDEFFELVLFGYDRVGRDFVSVFNKLEKKFLVVDFNPASIKKLEDEALPYRFGDASDVEFLEDLGLSQIKLSVSTIPDFETNLLLTKKIKEVNPKAIVIVISHDVKEAEELYGAGASYVVMPHYLGAQYAASLIGRLGTDTSAFKEEKEKHLLYLGRKYELV
ncbi:sodium:proton exchanger [Candidatus Microgenomates bacterium]|nr:MAG: sodium:proton exchanger [Candidatus Microgenomates bacterium]